MKHVTYVTFRYLYIKSLTHLTRLVTNTSDLVIQLNVIIRRRLIQTMGGKPLLVSLTPKSFAIHINDILFFVLIVVNIIYIDV